MILIKIWNGCRSYRRCFSRHQNRAVYQIITTSRMDPEVIADQATKFTFFSFVIDKKGVLRYVNYEYKVKEDYEPLMKVLAELD